MGEAADAGGARGGVWRPLLIVALMMAWNRWGDPLYEWLGWGDTAWPSLERLGLMALSFLINFGGFLWLGCFVLGRRTREELSWRIEPWPRQLAMGLALGATAVGLVYLAYFAMAGRSGVASLTDAIVGLPAWERVWFTVMGFKVALVEETVFRGDLLRALRDRMSVGVAVVISAVLFALYHQTLSPVSLAMKLTFGVLFAATTIRMRSIVPSTIAHGLMWAIVAEN